METRAVRAMREDFEKAEKKSLRSDRLYRVRIKIYFHYSFGLNNYHR